MEDLHNVGGIPALMKYLLNHTDLIDGSQLTVTGKTIAENLADVPELEFATQDVVLPLSNPIKATGHITILKGNLAPGTAVAKITGKEGLKFDGIAKCFDRQAKFSVTRAVTLADRLDAVWTISTLPLIEERSRRVRPLFSGTLGQRAVLECQRCVNQ